MEKRNSRSGGHGIHADGFVGCLEASSALERLRVERARLLRRLERFCHPVSLAGKFRLIHARRRLMNRIRARIIPSDSLFLCGMAKADPFSGSSVNPAARHTFLHLSATMMAAGMLAAQELSPPGIITHSVAARNSIEDLAPKDDGRYDYSVTCVFPQSAAFQEGFTLGSLSRRKGDRYWIKSIEADQRQESLALERQAIKFGYKLVILSDFKNTRELRDQIEGFNLAMHVQMMTDFKKQADR